MKTLALLSLFLCLAFQSELALAKNFSNEFVFHIITPKHRLKWKSPRSIAFTSALNSIRKDYAPIGHFAIEVNCEVPNKYGVSHFLTGMETLDGVSKSITLKKKLGLGSVSNYNFPGNIQNSEEVQYQITSARRDKRLTTVTVPTTASRCQRAMEFMDMWIENGSYTTYGGNKNFQKGEGAGCADFALHFFRLATSVQPKDDLFVKVRIPNRLIGDGLEKRIPFIRVLLTGAWAKDDRDSTTYITPDTNRVIDFLYKDSLRIDNSYTYVRHLQLENLGLISPDDTEATKNLIIAKLSVLPPYEIEQADFEFKYPQRETSEESWNRIKLLD